MMALTALPPGNLAAMRTWQSEQADAADRQRMTEHIFQIFQAKRPNNGQFNNKLPEFVKRLEDALYRNAASKDEYADINTLEHRLHDVAKRFVKAPAQQGPPGGPGLVPQQQQQQQNGGLQPVGPGMGPGMGMGQGIGGMPPQQQHQQQQQQQQQQQFQPMGPHPGVNAATVPQGFVPAPNGLPDPMRSLSGPVGHSMLPGQGQMQQLGDPSGVYLGGMIPTPNNQPAFGMQNVMSNGAPVLLRNQGNRDNGLWGGGAPQMLGQQGMTSAQNNKPLTINGMMPGQLANTGGMVPQQQQPSGVGYGGMVPMNGNNGMIPVNGPGAGMTSNSPMLNMNAMNKPLGGQGPMPGVPPNMAAMPGMMPVGNAGPFPGGPGLQAMRSNGMPAMPVPGPSGQPQGLPGVPENISDDTRAQYVQKQQRWLLFLRHCAKCRAPGDECQLRNQCKFGKQLWQHILSCQHPQCEYPRCMSSKELLKHHQKCQDVTCPVCAPVKDYVKKTRVPHQQQHPGFGVGGPPGMMVPNNGMMMQQPQQQQQLQQQQQQQQVMRNMAGPNQLGGQKRPHNMMAMGGGMVPNGGPMMGGMGMGMGMDPMQAQMQPMQQQQQQPMQQPQMMQQQPPQQPMQQPQMMMQQQQQQAMQQPPAKRVKSEDVLRQNTGTSLLETMDAKQIRVHLDLIWTAAAQARAQQVPPENPGDACKVCGVTKLSFEPPVIYCMSCGAKIKRGQIFYTTPHDQSNGEAKGYFCHQCFSDHKGDKIPIEGVQFKKLDLQKRKNDEEIEEGWVQCDACEGWVHQICGMFNKGRNNNDVHYLCPECLVKGVESGQRTRIEVRPQAMLEAKDMPATRLSEYITERLNRELEKEREMRAAQQGVAPADVPAPEPLTVRLINSVVKKAEVKPKFYETFSGDGYPTEYPYRQKVLLLFQNLDGVDVCLFCMYVQEYGRDCPAPNTNAVYLSYLDSVKYFRPEIPSALGPSVSLRTYVYHQLLIAYLEFVKALGFEQMYIWACPPMQGDDYILYCHPSKQKTPRSDRLRAWYIEMLKLAKDEGIVVHLSTLWDTYFEGGKDHRTDKCSATHIPYLEGDYWPGEAENQLANIVDNQRQATKKGPSGGGGGSGGAAPSRKAGGGTKGKRYGGGPATTDEQVMSRLGEILGGNMKEDFIVVHLQVPCTFCRGHTRGGGTVYRYSAPPGTTPPKAAPERKFEGIKLEGGSTVSVPAGPVSSLTVCESCLADERLRESGGGQTRLPNGVTTADLVMHKLEPQALWDKDPDPDMDNEFFDTRQTFLSLCQGNHYQFDTLRRAKHSSMMVLYHLHNPQSPAFASTCNNCGQEIEPGMGFRCTQCSDFDMCASCRNNVGHMHPHPLVPHHRAVDETRMRLTEQERRERNEQLQRTMALLVHACSCGNQECPSTSCRKVKQLFQHAVNCVNKVTGGCALCKKMWCLLNLHAKSCSRPDCPVPRCKELKELRRRQANRQEEKRRKAYQNMLRQQQAAQQRGQ